MARRRSAAKSIVVIYWRDIPAQVSAGGRTDGDKVLLDARFQHAIDRAAIVADKTDTESYVAEWRRTTQPLTGDPGDEARAIASSLDTAFPTSRLDDLVRNGGWEPAPGPTPNGVERPTPERPSP